MRESENRDFTEAEKSRGEHTRVEDVSVPESVATGRDNPPRGPQPYNPHTVHPSQLHGATHRNRHDEGLGPGDVVELTIRSALPGIDWEDCLYRDGRDGLREAVLRAGAAGKGINLIVEAAEPADPELIRELQAAAVPSRLIRRRG